MCPAQDKVAAERGAPDTQPVFFDDLEGRRAVLDIEVERDKRVLLVAADMLRAGV